MGFHLYLIRHAQSGNNALPESQRVEDPGITEKGIRQAELLAARFQGAAVTRLLTSGFRRAIETARPLAQALGIPPEIRTDLHEVGGCYRGYLVNQLEGRPGMNRAAIATEFPEFILPEDIDHQGWWKCRPYESDDQAMLRAETLARRLVAEFLGTAAVVACVIHADIKEMLLRKILQDGYPGIGSADLVNTGVTRLEFQSETPRIVEFNDARHLPSDHISS